MSSISAGRVIAGKYQLERPLAQGGMGSIWVARHLQLETAVAIKFIERRLADLPEARGRFEREAKASAQLQGPHVVQIYDYGVEDDNTPYMVMERLHGEDLSTRLTRETRLSLLAVDDIVRQVAKVLRRAQEAGIVHRDLKPGNIFLVRGEDEEIVKVLDFGVAKIPRSISSEEMTKSGILVGTPRYMSPEQARGVKTIDHRSDLWALAVIAFRAITGELPFQGDELGDVIIKICVDSIPTPSELVPGLSPAIDRFFERAFEREPDQRFQSAGDLSKAFTAAIGRPSLSDPETHDSSRPSTAKDDRGPRTLSADELRTAAKLSWFQTRREGRGDGDSSSTLARTHRAGRRRASAAAAVAILISSVGLILHAMFAKGSSHPPAGSPAAAILVVPAAEGPASPAMIADAPLPTAVVSALRVPPESTVRPASVEPAGAMPAAAPKPAPKRPPVKRKNPILGI